MDVKANVRLSEKSENLKGFANVVLNDEFVVTNVRIYEGEKGLFVSMPSYKAGDKYNDICFPTTKEFREKLHSAVLDEYKNKLIQKEEQKNDEKTETEQTEDDNIQDEEAAEGPVMSM